MSFLSVLFTGDSKSFYPPILDCLFKKDFLLKSKLRSLPRSLALTCYLNGQINIVYLEGTAETTLQIFQYSFFFFKLSILYILLSKREPCFSQRMQVPS